MEKKTNAPLPCEYLRHLFIPETGVVMVVATPQRPGAPVTLEARPEGGAECGEHPGWHSVTQCDTV